MRIGPDSYSTGVPIQMTPLSVKPEPTTTCGTGISEATLDEDTEIASQTFDATGEADPLALLITYGRSGPTTVKVQVTYNEP